MYLTVKDIAREAIAKVDSRVVFSKTIYRQYEKNFGNKIGASVTLRNFHDVDIVELAFGDDSKPAGQSINETPTELKIECKLVAPIKVSDEDMTLAIRDFSEQVLERGLNPLVAGIDKKAISKIKQVNKYAKKLGDRAPASLQDLSDISAQTVRQGFDMVNPTYFIMDPETKASIMGGAKETVTANTRGDNGTAFRTANFGTVLGMEGLVTRDIPETIVDAEIAKTGKISAQLNKSDGVQTINLAGLTAGKKVFVGNILEFTDKTSGVVSTCVVSEDKTFAGTTDTLKVESVDVDVVADSSFKVLNIGYNCVYQEKGFALCVLPLEQPQKLVEQGLAYKIVDPKTGYGFSVRMTYDYPNTLIYIDCLIAAKHIQHDLAFRVNSAR